MRKEIELSEATIKKLERLAKMDGRKLKPYMEMVLIHHSVKDEEVKPKRK